MKIKVQQLELTGSHYAVGFALGLHATAHEGLKKCHTSGVNGFSAVEVEKARILFEAWCPGMNEEIQGFADALDVPVEQIFYYGMTYLQPRCSQIALFPPLTASGRPLLARSYEFCHEADDFTLIRTAVDGKYAHIGTSVLLFGRDEGINEHGLAVTMSSAGFPVGPLEGMRKPQMVGLQYWAVIRRVLENCREVEEALQCIADMPIAYNINMMIMDRMGNLALVETMDGRKAVKRCFDDKTSFLCAANHLVLPELIPVEPVAMRHSIVRYEWLQEQLQEAAQLTGSDVKDLLLSPYPNGLCCHYYKEFFGTTKSIIFDPVCGTMEICWGGQKENGWRMYRVNEPLVKEVREIEIHFDIFDPKLAEFVPLKY